jgi:hypothetical protein
MYSFWVLVAYQWWFAVAYLISRLSHKLGTAFLYLGFVMPFMPDPNPPRRRLMPPYGPQGWMW